MSKKKFIIPAIIGAVVIIGAAGVVLTHSGTGSNSVNKATSSKDTFTYAISGDPSSLNPINVSDRWGLTAVNIIYSPLIRIEGDGTQKFELAKSLKQAPDGKSITVKLKDNIKWSDGVAFTADDVVFTYNEKVKKANGNADSLWIAGKPVTVEKLDDYTVKFNLPSVSAAAVSNIVTETYIIPKHVYQNETDFAGSEFKATPVGTGPYKLIKYKHGEYLQFKANDLYYGGKPKIPKVTLRIISNADTTKLALQKGEVDASYVLPADIKELSKDDLNIYEYSENRVGYMGLNNSSTKLNNVKVRQAVLYALDKTVLNKATYLSTKYFENAYSILPPGNPFATTKLEKYATNVAKTKSLLKAAGVTNLTLKLAFSSDDPVVSTQATLIQDQLKKAGITVELNGGDGSAIYTELGTPGSTKYDLFLGGYIMGNDPDLYSALFASDGSANYFQYKSAKTDALFKAGAVELDKAKRKDIYDQLQQQIAKDAPIYPIVDSRKVLAVRKTIGDVKQAGLVPIYTFEDISKLTIK